MLKTIKGKVIAVTAAFVLVSGASVAFGASDAGTKLRAWFDTQFNPAKEVVEDEVKAYLTEEMDSFKNVYNELITDGKTDIQDNGITETNKAQDSIETAAGEHIDSIINTQAEIERYMNSEFARLKSDAETRLNEATAEFKNDGDMRSQFNRARTETINTMNKQLDDSIRTAISDLQDAINKAKSELITSLGDKSSATNEAIKFQIDAKVTELRTTFEKAQIDNIKTQLNLIRNAAEKKENEAKKSMQDLVDGI